MTLPALKGLVFTSFRPLRSVAVRNRDLPPPSTTGCTMIRSSSTSPMRSRLTVRSELPKTAMSLPGCRLSLVSSSATSEPAAPARHGRGRRGGSDRGAGLVGLADGLGRAHAAEEHGEHDQRDDVRQALDEGVVDPA